MENLAFHSLLRWKVLIYQFSLPRYTFLFVPFLNLEVKWLNIILSVAWLNKVNIYWFQVRGWEAYEQGYKAGSGATGQTEENMLTLSSTKEINLVKYRLQHHQTEYYITQWKTWLWQKKRIMLPILTTSLMHFWVRSFGNIRIRISDL